MRAASFLERRRPRWDRLEELTEKAGKRVSELDEEELQELMHLYLSVAVDTARARLHGLDPATRRRVNRVAAKAHGLLYRRPRTPVFGKVLQFYVSGLPRLFRRLWACVALSTAIFVMGFLGSYVTARLRPSTAHLFVPAQMSMSGDSSTVTAEDISERFRQIPKPPMAAGIISNNISVAITAFAFGITAGVMTCYVVLVNAMMLGGFAAHFANHGLLYPFMSFVTPHGVLEIFAIMVAAGAGLRIGLSLALPGRLTRMASLRQGAREGVLLLAGTMPMFIVAGVIEGFITPSFIPGAAKMAIGFAVWGLFMAYLLAAGRPSDVPPGGGSGTLRWGKTEEVLDQVPG